MRKRPLKKGLRFQHGRIRRTTFLIKRKVMKRRIVDVDISEITRGRKILKTRAGPCRVACAQVIVNGRVVASGMLHVPTESTEIKRFVKGLSEVAGNNGEIKMKVVEGYGDRFSLAKYLQEHYPEKIKISEGDAFRSSSPVREVFFDTATGEVFVHELGKGIAIPRI